MVKKGKRVIDVSDVSDWHPESLSLVGIWVSWSRLHGPSSSSGVNHQSFVPLKIQC